MMRYLQQPNLLFIFALALISWSVGALEDRISVDKSCYEHNEAIDISFENTGHHPDILDWLALYRVERIDEDDLSDFPAMWVWTCGTQECRGVRLEDTLEFGPGGVNEGELDSWPLNAGEYRAILSGGSQPYQARAMSSRFTVMGRGEACESSVEDEDDDEDDDGDGDDDDENEEEEDDDDDEDDNDNEDTRDDEEDSTEDDSDNDDSATTLEGMAQVIEDARSDILALIDDLPLLGPKFLRLAFHDCVGGCDGCVDFVNPDNAGLGLPIDSLRPVVNSFEDGGLSRTDIWMLSALVAAEEAANGRMDFPMQWVGRKTCRDLNDNDCGESFSGRSTSCSSTRGPHRELCHGESGTETILTFFEEEFGFDAQQTVAIMGAHSVGRMRRGALGFDGGDGWDLTTQVLDQGYYVELVGGGSDPISGAPDWERELIDNGLEGLPDRHQWFNDDDDEDRMVMLNADIALVRQIDEGVNIESDGRVTCPFKGANRCPTAETTFPHMRRYRNSRSRFLTDFQEVLDLMVENGYKRTGTCPSGEVCRLDVDSR